jgi:cytochrome c biogenesis protein CcdA
MPVAVAVDWLIAPPRSAMTARHLLMALVFPALYLAYVIVRGARTAWYPYPFLDPAHVGGYAAVAAYALGITLTFLLAAWALLRGGNRIAASSRRSASA